MFETISHYRILRKLGAGGMGEVYLAQDTTLPRKVAIKFLPAEAGADELAGKRLIREARAIATLDHPNICAVYEVGEDQGRPYIVMQYVEGETLAARIKRQPLELQEALEVAVQVAEALQEAHAHGFVHRDVKPQNIMLTPRGQAKVLDFGLAKITRETALADTQAETVSLLTAGGAIMGTVLYMSPEQVKGEELDSRSDIFSLGTVIYELLSGRHPFSASSTAEIFSAILTRDPQPPNRDSARAPLEMRRIVARCLEKDREKRYPSAGELAIDLRRLQRETDRSVSPSKKSSPGPLRRPSRSAVAVVILLMLVAGGIYWFWMANKAITSVAVLPLIYTGSDPETEFTAYGIARNIIEKLSEIPDLRVMSRDAVLPYKGREPDARTVGRELGVRAVLIGRLNRLNDTLTIDLELVDARDNGHIWSKLYAPKVTDLRAVQHEIPVDISAQLRPRLSGEAKQRLAKRYTENPEAYEVYLKGRHSLERWNLDGAREAVGYFQEAINKDANYAVAYSGLADAYLFGAAAASDPKEIHRKAKEAAAKALKLDDALGEAHSAWAQTLLEEWNFSGAEREFIQAIGLSPSYTGVRHQYSHMLLMLGRVQESLTQSEKYLELDPNSPSPIGHLGYHYLYARQYDKAIEQLQKSLQLASSDPGSFRLLGDAYSQKKMFSEAVEEYLKIGYTSEKIASLREAFAKSGFNGFLRRQIEDLKAGQIPESNFVILAGLHARLGEKEEAFYWLEKAYEKRSPRLIRLKEELAFDSLRTEPHFADLLNRVGLPQ